jgi:hypothetical protein
MNSGNKVMALDKFETVEDVPVKFHQFMAVLTINSCHTTREFVLPDNSVELANIE